VSDNGEAPQDPIPQAVERKAAPRTLQLVWLVPVAALVIGGWLAVKAVWDRGITVTLQFQNGEGIEANKTRIKHKAVDIGIVRAVTLSRDRKAVIVTAEMDRSLSDGFLVEDTKFWVVRPRIAGGQVSGLGTLLAGSYIGSDPGIKTDRAQRTFVGLETPPPVTSDMAGTAFKLRVADLGSIDIGSPVYFRGATAGRVVSTEIPKDGKSVVVGVFVDAPYDAFVNEETRFWNASGFDLSLDASGVKVHTQSLLTVLLGGVAFETPPEAAAAPIARAESEFQLAENRTEALRPRETIIEAYRLFFDASVRGLAVGAPVDFRGIVVGEVRAITLVRDEERQKYGTALDIHFWPARMRVEGRDPPLKRMERWVARGFRGQLRSANLLTGQMYVALDFFPKVAPAKYDARKSPPEIPTIPGALSELQDSLGNIVATLEKVPFDKLAADVRTALQTLDVTMKRADRLMGQLSTEVAPELNKTLEQARKTFRAGEQMLQSDSPVQGDLRETLLELTKAAEQLRSLADYLERHPESLIRGRREGSDRK
jgi:paraquat-inducible protein B